MKAGGALDEPVVGRQKDIAPGVFGNCEMERVSGANADGGDPRGANEQGGVCRHMLSCVPQRTENLVAPVEVRVARQLFGNRLARHPHVHAAGA
ncbi:MAG: hypothetical protein AMXMBFR47_30320 [Planctomycetota bacterium]